MEGKRPYYLWLITLSSTLLFFATLWYPAAAQQAGNGITEPADGDTIGGVVVVRGTATDPNWLRYELAFRQLSGSDWIVFAEGEQQVVDGTLAVWDTTVGRDFGSPVFPDGAYQLRLRVVRQDYNYNEYFTSNLIISNDEPTPTPTITPTETIEGVAPIATTDPNATPQFQQPTALPSLTPFPTPSPPSTPVNAPRGPAAEGTEENEGGLLGQLEEIESGRFVAAFWTGMKWVGYAFVIGAGYLLLRGLIRRLWRLILTKIKTWQV
jgi:hypothetical protein